MRPVFSRPCSHIILMGVHDTRAPSIVQFNIEKNHCHKQRILTYYLTALFHSTPDSSVHVSAPSKMYTAFVLSIYRPSASKYTVVSSPLKFTSSTTSSQEGSTLEPISFASSGSCTTSTIASIVSTGESLHGYAASSQPALSSNCFASLPSSLLYAS